jgi:hypothetical protein
MKAVLLPLEILPLLRGKHINNLEVNIVSHDMKKFSKEERKLAALGVYILWAGIEARGLKKKNEYPLFNELHYWAINFSCPWCDMLGHNTGIEPARCERYCPLSQYEMEKCEKLNSNFTISSCVDVGSLYYSWVHSFSRKDAGDIAAVAWNEYKKLGG